MAEKRIIRLDTSKPLAEQLTDLDGNLFADFGDRLRENGWHHEDECNLAADSLKEFGGWEVLKDLHSQAHPGQHPDPAMCRQKPCCSLPMDVILGRGSEAAALLLVHGEGEAIRRIHLRDGKWFGKPS